MEHSSITVWLRKKAAYDATLTFVSGVLILAGGLMVVIATFFGACAVVWFVFHFGLVPVSQLFLDHPLRLPRGVYLAVSAATIVFLFVANARLRREYRRDLDDKQHVSFPSDLSATLVHLLAYPGASERKNADLLFCGPRLVEIGLDNVRKARRLSRLEVEDCARVIAVLASRDSRVPLSELSHEAGLTNLPEVCRQLRDFAGVVFLRFEPGLSLTSDLRNELFRELGIRPDRGTPPLPWNAFASGAIPHELPEGVRLGAQSTSAGSTPRLDPLPLRRAEEKGPQRRRFGDLLASTGGEDKVEGASNPINQRATASREEFEAAYRRWLQQSPGRPGAPDATGVSEAQRRIVLVNAAYEAFLSKHTKQREEGVQHEVEGVWEQFKGPSSAASGKAGRTK